MEQHKEVYTVKIKAGRRTYIFDVRQTADKDYYITISERRKGIGGEIQKQKIFLYKEDFNKFLKGLVEVINYVKTELMPDYDYTKFDNSPVYYKYHNEEGEEGEL